MYNRKYTWKMIKPLFPLTILVIWAVIFEDRIWDNWSTKEPLKKFHRGDLQWEYEMDAELSNGDYQFQMAQLEGQITGIRNDTLEIDEKLICKLDPSQSSELNNLSGMRQVTMKGRILSYNEQTKQVRMDHGFLLNYSRNPNE